jgi:FtsZ-interacting cell division protein ZipA
MSELQTGLFAIGALVVVAVLAYNAWQERRYRRETERGLKSGHDDILMAGSQAHSAPVGANVAIADAGTIGDTARIEPTLVQVGEVSRDTANSPILDEALDFVVAMEASEDVEGTALIDASVRTLSGFAKPVRIEGYEVLEARWEPLRHGARYSLMRAGLQLVDRRGAVAAEELTRFGAAAQQAAAAAGAVASVPDREEPLKVAEQLDRFCSEMDILIAVGVASVPGAGFAGTKLRALAESAGLALEEDGRFRRRDDTGRVLYELASMEAIPFSAEGMRALSTIGITLEFDVPRAPGGIRTFEQFRDLARHLAQGLGGQLVDDNRKPLSAAAFDQIQTKVEAVHRAMDARGIAAGSPAALRLFS